LVNLEKRGGRKKFSTLYSFINSEINFRRLKWGLMPQIETVRVKNGDSFAIINKADYDPETMTLFDGDGAKPKAKAKTTAKKKSVK
tara:strand:+ start:3493 stop:3750 length:258 start_codon:yes stop_codon:yes gene_type:complete